MSELRINNITDRAGSSGPIIAGVSTVTSTSHMVMPSGPTEMRGGRGRGVFGGGATHPAGDRNFIEKIEIATTANGTDFGDLSSSKRDAAATGSSIRGVFAGGGYPTSLNRIDYLNFSSEGGVNDFGDLIQLRFIASGASNNTRGIFAGGVTVNPSTPVTTGYNIIEFVTIATTGDSNEFGSLSTMRWAASGVNSTSRAIFAGGANPTFQSIIDFITIATLGDSQDFGELSGTYRNMMPACSKTRGVFAGSMTSPSSNDPINTIDFITMTTLGNTSDFGDLTTARFRGGGVSNSVRGVFAGGVIGPGSTNETNTIDFITITSTGNTTDFGDLTEARRGNAGASDSHGGLGD